MFIKIDLLARMLLVTNRHANYGTPCQWTLISSVNLKILFNGIKKQMKILRSFIHFLVYSLKKQEQIQMLNNNSSQASESYRKKLV